MTRSTLLFQRMLATLFVVLALINVLIAIVVIGRADSLPGYLLFGFAGPLWIAAGIGYLVAASGVVQLSRSWRAIALVAASLSAVLSAFALPTLLPHLLLDAAVILGVLRWSMRTRIAAPGL